MIELFNSYKNAGKISEALLVGRNIFNRHSGDKIVFDTYYDFLCTLAETLPSFEDRTAFTEQASVALAFFSENVEINDDMVANIVTYQNRLNAIVQTIADSEQATIETMHKASEAQNNTLLKKLYQVKSSLQSAMTQEQLDKALSESGVLDAEINKDFLSEEQNKTYATLTKEYTELISAKMGELEYKKNVAYNKSAAESFAKAFKQFRDDESKHKNQNQLFTLVAKSLFAYDASCLFNETLIYYNHVYSYIFSKLDDDGKLALTRYSIECERKLR